MKQPEQAPEEGQSPCGTRRSSINDIIIHEIQHREILVFPTLEELHLETSMCFQTRDL